MLYLFVFNPCCKNYWFGQVTAQRTDALFNSPVQLAPLAAENPPAATLVSRCVVNFFTIPFPNHPATAR
jgi:hypothetical protein